MPAPVFLNSKNKRRLKSRRFELRQKSAGKAAGITSVSDRWEVFGYHHHASLLFNVKGFAFNMFSRQVDERLCLRSHKDVTESVKGPLEVSPKRAHCTEYFILCP